MGTGNGSTATFQLVKTYGSGLRNYTRVIVAPVAGSVRVAVNGTETSQFTVNTATGLLTFNAGHVPAAATTIRAGFEFDVPVRFDSDAIAINLSHFAAGDIPDIPLIEVRS